ncbi:MAG: YdcF family protein [Bacilli bacterium]|nr:YdcF family protein [Bacilli bacterium]
MLYMLGIIMLIFMAIEFHLYRFGKLRDEKQCAYMIVLGAGLHGNQISSALKRRLDQAILYIQKYPTVIIIVSGGQGNNESISEGEAMKRYLLTKKIKENNIIVEGKSTSTYTNFVYSKQLISKDIKEVMVTTCDFHMYRACRIARKIGFIPFRNPAKSTKINCIKYYIRECFCVIKNWLLNT